MEHINKIEIQGRIGTVRSNVINDRKVVNFSVATDHLYKGKDGLGISETTWHNIVAWENKDMPEFGKIQKGVPVNVCGRLRTSKYTSADGTDKTFYEIYANRIKILNEEVVSEL